MKTILLCMPILLILAACSPIAVNTTSHSVFDSEARTAAQMGYKIGIGDDIEIKFTYNPELNERVPVRPDGRISLPLAKQIAAAGLTTEELEGILQQKYTPELKKPNVTVIVRGFYAQRVLVDGEVARPGIVPFMTPMTVLQSIAQSGGFRDTARITQVLVIRRVNNQKPEVTIIDLSKARDNSDMDQDIHLMPFDIVYVPRSKIAKVDLWVDQYIRRMIPFPLPQVFPTPTYIYQSSSSPVY